MLSFIHKNEDKFNSEMYPGILDVVGQGSATGRSVGRVLLPSDFTSSRRYIAQNYQDAIAICGYYGARDLFVTFTCNPQNGKRLTMSFGLSLGMLWTGQHCFEDFKIKLDALHGKVKDGSAFGPTCGGLCFLFLLCCFFGCTYSYI
jgi:hypothetical protein